MTAVLGSRSPARGVGDQLTFRFDDVNPLTGRTFAQSRFEDLPLLIGYLVEHLGLSWLRWDELAREGLVGEHIDTWRSRAIPYTVGGPLRAPRSGEPPADKCGDCWGTCVDIDADGSFTGVVGAAFICVCTRGSRA